MYATYSVCICFRQYMFLYLFFQGIFIPFSHKTHVAPFSSLRIHSVFLPTNVRCKLKVFFFVFSFREDVTCKPFLQVVGFLFQCMFMPIHVTVSAISLSALGSVCLVLVKLSRSLATPHATQPRKLANTYVHDREPSSFFSKCQNGIHSNW